MGYGQKERKEEGSMGSVVGGDVEGELGKRGHLSLNQAPSLEQGEETENGPWR